MVMRRKVHMRFPDEMYDKIVEAASKMRLVYGEGSLNEVVRVLIVSRKNIDDLIRELDALLEEKKERKKRKSEVVDSGVERERNVGKVLFREYNRLFSLY